MDLLTPDYYVPYTPSLKSTNKHISDAITPLPRVMCSIYIENPRGGVGGGVIPAQTPVDCSGYIPNNISYANGYSVMNGYSPQNGYYVQNGYATIATPNGGMCNGANNGAAVVLPPSGNHSNTIVPPPQTQQAGNNNQSTMQSINGYSPNINGYSPNINGYTPTQPQPSNTQTVQQESINPKVQYIQNGGPINGTTAPGVSPQRIVPSTQPTVPSCGGQTLESPVKMQYINSPEVCNGLVNVVSDQQGALYETSWMENEGPATVRMVSNNGPPVPMPMQVPPGHMVQQIVDENGILTHVILSPQMTSGNISGPTLNVGYQGPNGSPQQMYSQNTYGGPGYPPYQSPYPPHHHSMGPGVGHMHAGPPPHLHTTPPPTQCTHGHQHIHQQSQPQGPGHSPRLDDRTSRQKRKLQEKHHRKYGQDHHHSPNSQSPRQHRVNGDGRHDPHSSSSSGNEIDTEEEKFQEVLSKLELPKVSDVESRSALIQLNPPESTEPEFTLDPSDFRYELLLSDKGREGKYKLVYSGDATEITLKDLKPATEYFLRVNALYDDYTGPLSEPVSFKTECSEPDSPMPPDLANRSKTHLQLRWKTCNDNGSKISKYLLEFDRGHPNGDFEKVYEGPNKTYKVTRLTASTNYCFRLAAVNSIGQSEWSDCICHTTSGSVPSQPDPPMLSEQLIKALVISWIKRPNDEEFTLQMEDSATGYGFQSVYNGPDLSYFIEHLRRNTEYKFRMSANNEEGSSKWSDAVKYRTLPDRPGAPQRPQVKGKVHPTSFRVNWDDPRDSGGSEITKFILELDEGRGFDEVYKGPEKDYNCDRLLPGQTYRCRLCCFSKGGKSDWSDSMAVTLPPVTPGPCLPPKLRGKPKATSVCLQWGYPDYDGGAPVTVFEINMTNPDSSNRECYKGPDLECTVAGLLPGRPYLFQVRASNKAGCGPWSERVELISGAGVPDAPKTPSVHCKSPHSAMIWWEEPVNNGATITDYRLEWSTGGDSDFTQLYYGPGLTYEVKSLTPASEYCFRVQAINATGVGPVSDSCTCVTPPSSPSTVTSIRTTTTADSISISWREPQCNGSEILSYNIDIGERHLIPVGNVTDFTIDSLIPETTYKVRIQALNGIGVGAFSSPIKVTTRSLPPPPPHLECVLAGPNSLKLKWGEGRNPDMLQYILEMKRDNGSFYHVYQGPSQMQKVNRLQETTDYFFRISASNEAGEGPYSEVYQFTTTKAPPPAVKAPKVSDISLEGASVEWSPCKQMGKDPLNYVLQVQSKNEEYKQIYSGSETMYKLSYLEPNTEYVVRVCAERLCQDGSGSLLGAFSPGIIFYTHSQEPIKTVGVKSESGESSEPKQLTDQQWAMIILAVCAFLAILLAFLAKQFISYSKPS